MTSATAVSVESIVVLLVEDSIDHQMLTSRALGAAAVEVLVASSAEEALEILAEQGSRIHLVLIDHGLPAMSGMELLRRIVKLPDPPGAIMVTASNAGELVLDAMRSGAIDFVSKESGYLGLLPAVVQRAFRQYDLRQRAKELQRLALLVHRAPELEDTIKEVVVGACKLLGAPAGLLLLERMETPGSWTPAARVGAPDDLSDATARRLALAGDEVVVESGLLAVRLPMEIDEQAGVLVVARSPERPWQDAEVDLARIFAAYVSSALRHVRRAEMEGGLIEELQNTIRVRRDFVASVSHELRTPLTSIGGYAETILQHSDMLPKDTLLDLVERIRRNAGELERMIDQLIDVARLERGTRFAVTVETLSLPMTLADAIDGLGPLLLDTPVTVEAPNFQVSGDRELVHRVMVNLLTNAVKYTPDGGPIQISASLVEDFVLVEVRDHGIGVPPGDAQLIFQPFWRASYAVAQAVRGTGIGLALVREYITEMGGTVGVRAPSQGAGSVFWFTLPLAGAVNPVGSRTAR